MYEGEGAGLHHAAGPLLSRIHQGMPSVICLLPLTGLSLRPMQSMHLIQSLAQPQPMLHPGSLSLLFNMSVCVC